MEPTYRREEQRRLFHTLDMLRGIAAIAVVGLHLDQTLAALLPGSYLAVDFFFVLSGFVLTHAYQERLQHGLGVVGFMRIRLIRLYPMYILGTAVGVAIYVARMLFGHNTEPWAVVLLGILLAALFLPAPRAVNVDPTHLNGLYPFNGPAWSLFWELAVNLLYSAIAPRLGPKLLGGLIVLGAALLVAGAVVIGDISGGWNLNSFEQGAMRVLYSFFAGVAIYRIWSAGRLPWLRLPPAIAALILLAIMAARPEPRVWYDLAAILFAFPLVVLASTADPGPRAQRICTMLGLISYPIYALHENFARFESSVPARLGLSGSAALALELAFVAGMIVFALLVERLVDRPLRRWLGSHLPFAPRAPLPRG